MLKVSHSINVSQTFCFSPLQSVILASEAAGDTVNTAVSSSMHHVGFPGMYSGILLQQPYSWAVTQQTDPAKCISLHLSVDK